MYIINNIQLGIVGRVGRTIMKKKLEFVEQAGIPQQGDCRCICCRYKLYTRMSSYPSQDMLSGSFAKWLCIDGVDDDDDRCRQRMLREVGEYSIDYLMRLPNQPWWHGLTHDR